MRIVGQYESAAIALSGAHEPVRSLYIHVPFCFHKCHYCDFYSVVADADRHEPFVHALLGEFDALAPHAGPLRTIFVGGGTPTLLSPAHWRRILERLHDRFDTSALHEFTVECNPETATPDLLATLANGGVNRLSVGCQSFHPSHLATLERWHEPPSVARALQLAHDAGVRRLSIDLIFGIPGQTMDDWLADLRRACDLAPRIGHISCYALTVEQGTALAERIRQGDMAPPDEHLQAEMYEATVEFLGAEGFERYETSNFARDEPAGGPCAHNLVYWRQGAWLAAGPSASAHIRTASGSWRYKNAPRGTDWIEGVLETGYAPVTDLEAPDPARLACEVLMTGIRLSEGVDLECPDLATLNAPSARALRQAAAALVARAHASLNGSHLVLNDAGMLQADAIASDLMACVE